MSLTINYYYCLSLTSSARENPTSGGIGYVDPPELFPGRQSVCGYAQSSFEIIYVKKKKTDLCRRRYGR